MIGLSLSDSKQYTCERQFYQVLCFYARYYAWFTTNAYDNGLTRLWFDFVKNQSKYMKPTVDQEVRFSRRLDEATRDMSQQDMPFELPPLPVDQVMQSGSVDMPLPSLSCSNVSSSSAAQNCDSIHGYIASSSSSLSSAAGLIDTMSIEPIDFDLPPLPVSSLVLKFGLPELPTCLAF
jgi:hypothetical protein